MNFWEVAGLLTLGCIAGGVIAFVTLTFCSVAKQSDEQIKKYYEEREKKSDKQEV
ncbi:MAG: hypothetical protein ACI4HO_08840 [Ruminococcus sp.]